VFGVDGGTWHVIEPMIEAGELPNLARYYNKGIHGELRSRPPAISPVVWSTIFTGRLPEEHGVKDWKSSQSTYRKVKTVWEMASDKNLTAFVFNVPSTWPPTKLHGVMLSGFPLSGSQIGGNTGEVFSLEKLLDPRTKFVYRVNAAVLSNQASALEVGQWSPWFRVPLSARHAEGVMKIKRLDPDRYYFSPFYRVDEGFVLSYPPDLRDRYASKIGDFYIPEGPGWSKHAEPDTPRYLYEHILDVSKIQTRAAAAFASGDWDLFVYVNTLVDRVSHPYWAYMEPDAFDDVDPAKAKKYQDTVREAYRQMDVQLGQVLANVGGDDFYLVVVSDHGFGPSRNKNLLIGTHRFDGIYLVAGPGLHEARGPRINIEDTAPTILYLLGLPTANDLAGKLLPPLVPVLGVPKPPVRSYEYETRPGSDVPVDAQTWEQLRGLGYVDGAPPRRH